MKSYPYILIIGSLIGLLASFFLMIDTISLIKDPAADLPCNLNPFISCGNAILSKQGEVFGFPNPLLGIVSFSIYLTAGVMLFLGAKVKKYFWQFINLILLGSTIFVIWFVYQSLYSLGTLCIYCMIIWAVTWPLFLYTTIWNLEENNFIGIIKEKTENKLKKFLIEYHLPILSIWYIAIILLILFRFKDFFIY